MPDNSINLFISYSHNNDPYFKVFISPIELPNDERNVATGYAMEYRRWYHNHYLRKSILRQAQNDKTMEDKSLNFLEEIIEEYLKNGKYKEIVTHFSLEQDGYFTPLPLMCFHS
jgi:hypothetical protein